MDPLFEVHRLNEEGLKKAGLLATAYDNLATAIEECRHRAVTRKECCPHQTRGVLFLRQESSSRQSSESGVIESAT
jgi:hypothetical protein